MLCAFWNLESFIFVSYSSTPGQGLSSPRALREQNTHPHVLALHPAPAAPGWRWPGLQPGQSSSVPSRSCFCCGHCSGTGKGLSRAGTVTENRGEKREKLLGFCVFPLSTEWGVTVSSILLAPEFLTGNSLSKYSDRKQFEIMQSTTKKAPYWSPVTAEPFRETLRAGTLPTGNWALPLLTAQSLLKFTKGPSK